MGIRISERDDVFHVPYGVPNSDGTPEANFVDLKARPNWVAVLPPCVGWPETRDLLRAINSPESSLMSLATDQAFAEIEDLELKTALTSFVTLCYADLGRNEKGALSRLAESLKRRVSDLLLLASEVLQRRLSLDLLLEVQPTIFHVQGVNGWSLTVLTAAYGRDEDDARSTWGVGMKALQEALMDHDRRER